MKTYLPLVWLRLFFASLSVCQAPQVDAAPFTLSKSVPSCPGQTGWAEYRRQMAAHLSMSHRTGGTRAILDKLAACLKSTFLTQNPGTAACFEGLKLYTQSMENVDAGRGSGMGFNVKDALYDQLTAQFTALPPELAEPKMLWQLSSLETLAQARRKVDELNEERKQAGILPIQIGTYRSSPRALGESRVIVYYPDPKSHRELWFQTGIAEKKNGPPAQITFVYSVVTNPDGTQTGYFRRYQKTHVFQAVTMSQKDEQKYRVMIHPHPKISAGIDCTRCHIAERPIALDTVREPSDPELFRTFNRILRSYRLKPSPYFHPDERGPTLASAETRSDEFLLKCGKRILDEELRMASATTRPEIEKKMLSHVRSAMNCANCHQSGEAGLINGVSVSTIGEAIEDGRMPPKQGAQLSVAERKMLTECLVEEYFGSLDNGVYTPGVYYSALTEEPCPTEGKVPAPAGAKRAVSPAPPEAKAH